MSCLSQAIPVINPCFLYYVCMWHIVHGNGRFVFLVVNRNREYLFLPFIVMNSPISDRMQLFSLILLTIITGEIQLLSFSFFKKTTEWWGPWERGRSLKSWSVRVSSMENCTPARRWNRNTASKILLERKKERKKEERRGGIHVLVKCACHDNVLLCSSMTQVNNLREIQALRRLNPHPNVIELKEVIL